MQHEGKPENQDGVPALTILVGAGDTKKVKDPVLDLLANHDHELRKAPIFKERREIFHQQFDENLLLRSSRLDPVGRYEEE